MVVVGLLLIAAALFTNNAERQNSTEMHRQLVTLSAESDRSAPYQHCPKLKRVGSKWRELRTEIAQQRGDGWEITCSYWGQELMTRDEARL